jgi:uncharacterized protein
LQLTLGLSVSGLASRSGYCQWATAKERPPHLTTIVPMAAPCLGVDFPMRNHVLNPYVMQWITLTSGRSAQRTLFSDREYWAAQVDSIP